MRSIYLTCISLLIGYNGHGQQDSVLLQSVNITANRLETFAVADKLTAIDLTQLSLFNGRSVAQLLSAHAPLNIRAYGLGGLSTASMRGTGSNHTAVIWEGLNLQSQMNGSLDLNILPLIMVDNISIQSGASSTLFGSGALGGTIQLGSLVPTFNKSITVTINELVGSFGHLSHGLKVSASNKTVFANIRVFLKTAENDFSFYNIFTQEEETMQNAAVLQTGFMGELGFKIGNNQQINSKYWYQYNNTEIPKTASAGLPSNAFQHDITHRGIVKYEGVFNKLNINYKLGFLNHILDYDDQISISSHNHSTSVINELLLDYALSKHIAFEFGSNYTSEFGKATNFDTDEKRDNLAIFFASNFSPIDQLEINVSGRQTFVDNTVSPFLPSLGIRYQFSNLLAIKTRVAKSFRAPTFNDLYWHNPGTALGNPDLKTEDGINSDLGYELSISKKALNYEGTIFYNHINNWISWQESDGIWTPINANELWSYGIEQHVKAAYNLSSYASINLIANYQFVISTLEKPTKLYANSRDDNPEPSIFDYKQTTYTPKHQGNIFLQWQLKKINASITESITGKQYTDNNNTEIRVVDLYALTDLSIGYDLHITKSHTITTYLKINNIFNTSYEVRRAYPMPGINYQFNLVYNFN